MNTNEIFHKMVTHVITQGEQSIVKSTTTCRYRYKPSKRDVTLMCAVGCLITDEHYTTKLEYKHVNTPEVRAVVVSSIGRQLSEGEYDMLATVQNIHDCSGSKGFVDEFKQRVVSYVTNSSEARSLGLTLPENF